ncbi:hypothetical protein KCU77_g9951, partial [Aureobasidium melanogenum]
MHSRSPTPERDAVSRSPYSRASRSPSRTPRRSISPRPSPSPQRRSRSRTRTRSPAHSRSRSRSYRARSTSRGRDRSPTPPMPRSSKIVIEKLTKNVTPAHLNEIFSTYGAIADLDMPLNKSFNTNRGTAYVLYTTPEAAERAIAHMHEGQLDGAKIGVSIVLPRRRFSRSPPARRPPPNRFGEPHRYRDMAVAAAGGRGGGGRGGRRRGDDGDTYRPGPARDAPPRNRSYSPRSRILHLGEEEEALEEEVEVVVDAGARVTAATARAAEAEAEAEIADDEYLLD